MITITKKLKRNHYQPENFGSIPRQKLRKKQSLKWKHWGKYRSGQYGISDDGYVAEYIYRKEYGDKLIFIPTHMVDNGLLLGVNWSLNRIGGLIT